MSGSVALTTDYISRGQSQTFGSAAVQGGLEANITSVLPGFLIGTWGSNVSDTGFQNGADMEFDVYTGYAHKFNDDLSAKIVGNWCMYPGAKPTADPSQTYNAFELIPSVTYRWLTVLFAYSFTDKAGFNSQLAAPPLTPNGDSRGSWYFESSLRVPLFRDDLNLNLVYGYQEVRHYTLASYSNYGASVDYTLPDSLGGLNLKLGVAGTDNDKRIYTVANNAGETLNVGRTRFYFTLTKSF